MRFIDLTHTFHGDMPVYPGDPCSELRQIATLESEGFVDHELKTGLHVGTHIDAPLHMIAGGMRLSDIPIEKFFGRGHLIDVREQPEVLPEVLEGIAVQPGDILLLLTGHGTRFGQPDYYAAFPVLSEAFAERAVELGVAIVGMDTPSPDLPPFPVHKILLGNGTLIIENLTNLEALLGMERFDVAALPLKLQADAAAVRVVAMAE